MSGHTDKSTIDSYDARAHRRRRRGGRCVRWTRRGAPTRGRCGGPGCWSCPAGRSTWPDVGGVLGDDVRPETVTAALGLIAPGRGTGRLGGGPQGRPGHGRRLAAGRVRPVGRRATLRGGRTSAWSSWPSGWSSAADAVAMPLFAAARAMPAPDGGPGARAAVLAHLLREHRAGAMLVAVRACGLRPVEAIIAGPEGEQEAITFGWHAAVPDPRERAAPVRLRRGAGRPDRRHRLRGPGSRRPGRAGASTRPPPRPSLLED